MLSVTQSDRAEPLARRMAHLLSVTPGDPMVPEWIATQGSGMQRWLWLELARHLGARGPSAQDGIAANITPGFVGSLRAAVLAAGRSDAEDPWEVGRLTWVVLAEMVGGACGTELRGRFGHDRLGYGQARRVADLFDRYHLHRPWMVRRWAAGDDIDALGARLEPQHRWQPTLWRRVREAIGEQSPPEYEEALLGRLASGDLEVDLPPRLCMFGLSVFPGGAGFVELAEAVAAERDLHLFLVDPSPGGSAKAVASAPRVDQARIRRRSDDQTSRLVENRLLRSWGRLPRETSVLLTDAARGGFPEAMRIDSDEHEAPATLLGRVQSDVRHGLAPDGRFRPSAHDRSLQFHAAPGASRQIDVARDVVIHALDEDPTLVEDDVLVVCPNLKEMAPLFAARFGPPARVEEAEGGTGIRYHLSDRSFTVRNPLQEALSTLLDLLPGRFDVVTVLAFLAEPAIRARHGFNDADLARIAEWATTTNVRWGLDASHRAPFGLPEEVTTNTWSAAIERLLVGSTVPDDELLRGVGDVAPVPIEGGDVEMLGRLADLFQRLRSLVDLLDHTMPLQDWLSVLRASVGALFSPPDDDERQDEALRRVLYDIEEQASAVPAAASLPIGFVDLRRLLREHLGARSGRPAFFRGGVTITSLESLRRVPFRMIVMVGMDQSAFAPPSGDGDDLTALVPLVGDRDERADRRLAVLEALMAAGDRLVVIRDCLDLRTSTVIPPATVVADLLDTVAATLAGTPAPEQLEVRHPRQAFDERNFTAGALGGLDGPWSHDVVALAAANARRERRAVGSNSLDTRLPELPLERFELSELITATAEPVKFFFRHRLDVTLPDDSDRRSVAVPLALKGLDAWRVRDRLMGVLADHDALDFEDWLRTERGRGLLPPGSLGAEVEAELAVESREITALRSHLQLVSSTSEAVPIDLNLPDGTRIVGSVTVEVGPTRRGPVVATIGRIRSAHELAAWLELMALTVAEPDVDWTSILIGQPPEDKDPSLRAVELRVVGNDAADRVATASGALGVAVEVARHASLGPIPLFASFSRELHVSAASGRRLDRNLWKSYDGRGEGTKPYNRFAFGDMDVAELLDLQTLTDDPFDAPRRAQGWADFLWEARSRSIDVVDLGTADDQAAQS